VKAVRQIDRCAACPKAARSYFRQDYFKEKIFCHQWRDLQSSAERADCFPGPFAALNPRMRIVDALSNLQDPQYSPGSEIKDRLWNS